VLVELEADDSSVAVEFEQLGDLHVDLDPAERPAPYLPRDGQDVAVVEGLDVY
jgi:hypothetical protein